MPTVKGTASVADSRARQKALKTTKFPRSFKKAVSLEKMNKPVLTQWIEQKITSILGFEDEIVSSTAINLFLPSDNTPPDPKKAQLDLAGFLGDQAVSFSAELWKLMLEAQDSNVGIPETLLEQKKKEMSERRSRNDQNLEQQQQNVRVHQSHLRGSGTSSTKQDMKSDKNSSVQLGRVHAPHRPKTVQRSTPRDQYSHNRPDHSETSRYNHCRSRSRERYERGSGYRRRADDRYHWPNDDRRRFDDIRRDSIYRDNRSVYHHNNHHHNNYFDHERYHEDNRRRESHDYDREMHHLKRRLSQLENHTNWGNHGVDNEINHVRDRIYQLERQNRKSSFSREDYPEKRRRSTRLPTQEYRRSSRHKRSDSTDSGGSDSIRRSRDYSSKDNGVSNRGDTSRRSRSPERTKKNKDTPKGQRRRRLRSSSSSDRSERSP